MSPLHDSIKIPVIAVLGPTASGKTALAIALAKRFDGEIISCDSMQIYQGMDIATAKPSAKELAEAKHHLIGFLSPEQSFSAAEYVRMASECIADIYKRGKTVFLCGGTGLYADALLSGMQFPDAPDADQHRAEILAFYQENGAEALLKRLEKADPAAAAQIDCNNIKRVLRAVEICESSGLPLSVYQAQNIPPDSPYRTLRLVLDFQNRENLYARINARVDQMVQSGLFAEAEIYFSTANSKTAAQAIGYKELKPYFDGEISKVEAIAHLKQATRRYAKRQQTWLRREQNVCRLYVDGEDILEKAVAVCEKFQKGETGY